MTQSWRKGKPDKCGIYWCFDPMWSLCPSICELERGKTTPCWAFDRMDPYMEESQMNRSYFLWPIDHPDPTEVTNA